MGFRVTARFFHRASGAYIDPGQECPPLPVEDAARLVRARCLVEEKDPSPPSGNGTPATRKTRPPRQEAATRPEERGASS